MSGHFELHATVREDTGKGASRRLRRHADLIPAIIYGGGKAPQSLSLVRKDVEKALENEAFFSQVITLSVAGSKEQAILKDLQRHPSRHSVMHADFMRIDEKVAIKVHVPIHFLNETTCIGVKMQGGIIQHQATDIEVLALPGRIPAYIEVDMQGVETGDIVHLSEIKLPEGVTSVALALGEDHDLAIASVIAPRGMAEEEAEEGDGEADSAAPEEQEGAGEDDQD